MNFLNIDIPDGTSIEFDYWALYFAVEIVNSYWLNPRLREYLEEVLQAIDTANNQAQAGVSFEVSVARQPMIDIPDITAASASSHTNDDSKYKLLSPIAALLLMLLKRSETLQLPSDTTLSERVARYIVEAWKKYPGKITKTAKLMQALRDAVV